MKTLLSKYYKQTQFDLVTFRLTNGNIAVKILPAKTQFDLVTFRLTNENTAAKILPVGLIMTIRMFSLVNRKVTRSN
jgi:chemotaxis signal transduction protein